MLRIADNQAGVLPYLHLIYMHKRHDEICAWLLRNRLTGLEFLAWADARFGKFRLDLLKYVIREIDRDVQDRAIIAGRDLIVR